jgi:hypothetical protein
MRLPRVKERCTVRAARSIAVGRLGRSEGLGRCVCRHENELPRAGKHRVQHGHTREDRNSLKDFRTWARVDGRTGGAHLKDTETVQEGALRGSREPGA